MDRRVPEIYLPDEIANWRRPDESLFAPRTGGVGPKGQRGQGFGMPLEKSGKMPVITPEEEQRIRLMRALQMLSS